MSEILKNKLPEEEGVPSLLLIHMMEEWEKELCHVHAFMILRHGNIISEGYKYPYCANDRRLLHSISKAVTAIAIGFAVTEKKLCVKDKVLDFFPEYKASKENSYLKELRIEHLLSMSAGHRADCADAIRTEKKHSWEAYLDCQIENKPGTRFLYDSGGTYMLSVILTRVTGLKIIDYLTPRLFEPLGIDNVDWDIVDGVNTGGWGLMLHVEDMAKLGQLFLQKGNWNGKQILSQEWIEEATSIKIQTLEFDTPYLDWQQGYCYQMWKNTRNESFRADGAFGQYILIMPEKDMVAVIWSEDAFSQDMLDVFWREVYDKVDNRVYHLDGNAQEVYTRILNEWTAPTRISSSASYKQKDISENQYNSSVYGKQTVDSITFYFEKNGKLKVCFKKKERETTLYCNNTTPNISKTKFVFEIPTFIRLGEFKNNEFKYAASYEWMTDHVMRIHLIFVETPHYMDITCIFSKGEVYAIFSNSYEKLLYGSQNTSNLLIDDQTFVGIRS